MFSVVFGGFLGMISGSGKIFGTRLGRHTFIWIITYSVFDDGISLATTTKWVETQLKHIRYLNQSWLRLHTAINT